MSELRRDPVAGRWVIIAPERGARPSDYSPAARRPRLPGPCPLCPGHERETPPELLAGRPGASAPDTPGWTYRVVPNRFPALQAEGDLEPTGEGLYDRMRGIGAHEVLIETPRHDATLATLSVDDVAEVLLAARERMVALAKDDRLEYVLFFKNQGEPAGATLQHPHSQLLATPIVPPLVAEELAGAARHHAGRGRCVWCDIVHQERGGERRVLEGKGFTVIAPYASRVPFETWILPTSHRSSFEDSGVDDLLDLARTLGDVLRRLDRALEAPPYNLLLHTAPLRARRLASYHWHLELMPKLTRVAGFEWGSGIFVNATTPEASAARLRESGERA